MNHDGFISREDYELMATRFQEYCKMNRENTELSRVAFMSVADALGLKPGVKISVEEAAKKASEEICDILSQERKMAMFKGTHELIFDAVDLNKDGHISLDEYKVYFHTVAPDVSDADMIHSFDTIDTNKNGEISREEFLKAASDFLYGFEETELSKVFFGPLL